MGPYYDIVSLMLWRLPEPGEEPPQTQRNADTGQRSRKIWHRLSGMHRRTLRSLVGML